MNIAEFARRAKVSTATISRAFHEPGKLRQETRERVLSLARELGYYPSPTGRALKRGRHDVLGVVWPLEVEGAGALFALRVLASLTRHLVANDLDLLVCPMNRSEAATLAHATRTIQRSRCDAWILLYPRHHDTLIQALEASRKPVVCLMGELRECAAWKSVRLNQESWIADALLRFQEAGCKSVMLFGSREEEPDHLERKEIFFKLAPRHFGASVFFLPGWLPEKAVLRECLFSNNIDAIIGIDDRAALLALDLCREAGLDVPKKIKVVGIDDVPQSEFSLPPLSTYRQPLDEMAGFAVELALGRRERTKRFEATFVPRESIARF